MSVQLTTSYDVTSQYIELATRSREKKEQFPPSVSNAINPVGKYKSSKIYKTVSDRKARFSD